jgi:hypothetical protein
VERRTSSALDPELAAAPVGARLGVMSTLGNRSEPPSVFFSIVVKAL